MVLAVVLAATSTRRGWRAVALDQQRVLHPVILFVLRPLLHYSRSRDAYVLRAIGNRWGPVLRR